MTLNNAALCLFFGLAGCGQTDVPTSPAGENQASTATAVTSALPVKAPGLPCREDGRLQTELFGALDGRLDWSAAQLECSGMPRPNGAGARLRFAGQVDGFERRIDIIIAIPGLLPGAADAELASKITLIDESSGRFFSTWDMNNCWTDITSQERTGDTGETFNIDGTFYCVAPLAEVNGDASVSIIELNFAGSLDWNAK